MTTLNTIIEGEVKEYRQMEISGYEEETGEDLETWLTTAMQRAYEAGREEERERSTKLWGLLDDIDTLPDIMHPTTSEAHANCWRRMVEIAHKRHKILKTDGFTLFDHTEPDQPTETITVGSINDSKVVKAEIAKGQGGYRSEPDQEVSKNN